MSRKIYVASSWRNPYQPHVVASLRDVGHEVYDFRHPAPNNEGFSWSEVNPGWKDWSVQQFAEDLYSGHPKIEQGFAFDKGGLEWCDTCVMVLPCGRSAHLEAGWCAGRDRDVFFFLHPDKFEPELMYLLGDGCFTDIHSLVNRLQEPTMIELTDVLTKKVVDGICESMLTRESFMQNFHLLKAQ